MGRSLAVILVGLSVFGLAALASQTSELHLDRLSLDHVVHAHSFPGRPLSLRAGKSVKFDKFQDSPAADGSTNPLFAAWNLLFGEERYRRNSRRGGQGEGTIQKEHFVVRVTRRDREAVRQRLLKEVAEPSALQYLPMDTFVVTITSSAVSKVSTEIQGVEGVYRLPMEMKAPPELLHRLIPSSAGRTRENTWRTLDISLGYSMPSLQETESLIDSWNTQLREAVQYSSTVRPILVGSRRKVSLQAHDSTLHKAIRFLLEQPETLWLEERAARGFKNKFATEIVAGEKVYFWEPEPAEDVDFVAAEEEADNNSTSTAKTQVPTWEDTYEESLVEGNWSAAMTQGNWSDADGRENTTIWSPTGGRRTAGTGGWNETGGRNESDAASANETVAVGGSADTFNVTGNTSAWTEDNSSDFADDWGDSDANATDVDGKLSDLDGLGDDVLNRTDARDVVANWSDVNVTASDGEIPAMGGGTAAPAEDDWKSANGLWRRGLTGEGQIVGICDSGVDVDSCFFHDPHETAPLCFQHTGRRRGERREGWWYATGVVEDECVPGEGAAAVNYEHRKIVGYRVHEGGGAVVGDEPNDRNDRYGTIVHGTMVAGSLAGAAYTDNAEEMAFSSEYNGIAPGAKLAVDDVSMDSWADGMPQDLVRDLWPWSYNIGARVHVNSWADESVLYTHVAAELDEFTWANPDFTVVMAAGNFGPNAVTVLSPGTAKNAITVGATENNIDSYLEYDKLIPEFRLERVPSNPEYVGTGHHIHPAAFAAPMKLSRPVSAPMLLLGADEGCGAVEHASMVPGKIVLAMSQDDCLHSEMVVNLEQKGAVAVILLSGSDVADSSVGDAQPSIMAGYMEAHSADVTIDLLNANPKNGSMWMKFPVSWKQGPHALAGFSSRGPTPDGRFKPDIVAPGDNIRTAASDRQADSFQCASDGSDPALATGSGTSLAAPFVAGAAAIIRQYFEEGMYDGTSIQPSAALVKAMILNSGVGLTWYYDFADWALGYGRGVDGHVPAFEQGYGRVQLDRVLRFHGDVDTSDQPDLHVVDSEPMADGDSYSLCLMSEANANVERESEQRPLKITLVWTDPPASPSSWGLLINDLDLLVTGPDGEMSMGNQLVAYNSINKEHPVLDNINTNEQITLDNPARGVYRIDVVGQDVPIGPQAFSLVVTGRFTVMASCPQLARCPHNCSNVGRCENGICQCPLSRRGVSCELHNVELVRNRQVTDMISSGGWSYYYFHVTPTDRWQVEMESTVTYADPDIFIAVDRLPTLSDHDAAHLHGPDLLKQYFSDAHVSVTRNSTIVVGINVFCCYHAAVKMTLTDMLDGVDVVVDDPVVDDKYPPDPAPRDGDPVDVVTFMMALGVSKSTFQKDETEYRKAVAAVASIHYGQVSVRYVSWTDDTAAGGDRRSVAQGSERLERREDLNEDMAPVTPDARARERALRSARRGLRWGGPRRLMQAGGANGTEPHLVVEFVLVVLEGKGHQVAVQLQGGEVYDEIAQRSLPAPLNVYDHRFKEVVPGEEDEHVEVPQPKDQFFHPTSDSSPAYTQSKSSSKVTQIAITLTCCLVVAAFSFAVLYFKRKGSLYSQAHGHSSLVFIESGHTPGSPTAPDFVDASTAVRGLILQNGLLVMAPDCEEPRETPGAHDDPNEAGVTPHDEETPREDVADVVRRPPPTAPHTRRNGTSPGAVEVRGALIGEGIELTPMPSEHTAGEDDEHDAAPVAVPTGGSGSGGGSIAV